MGARICQSKLAVIRFPKAFETPKTILTFFFVLFTIIRDEYDDFRNNSANVQMKNLKIVKFM